MARDSSQIKFEEYDVRFKGEDLGYTKMDSTMTSMGMTYREVKDAAQFTGIVAKSKSGAAPTLKVVIYQTDFPNVFDTIAGNQVYPIVDGAKLAWGLGSRKLDLFDEAGEIILHPTGVDNDDYSRDIMYWLAVPDLSAVELKGSRDGAMSIEIPFTILPDTTQSLDLTYGIYGDHTAVEADPYTVYITTEAKARAPYNHTTALTLLSKAKTQVYAYGFYKTNSSVTAAVNEAGNVAATDASFDFDTLSTASNFAVGDYLLCGTEVMQITAITYATTTTGTITVNRHIAGTTAAAHLDNAAITKLSNVYVIPVTRRATWTSTAADDVTVGNSNALGNKGLLTWLADGSDTITAAVGSTTSPNLTVTAAA